MPPPQQILLIEDDLPLAEGLFRALQQMGYKVSLARTAATGMAALAETHFDLIVLDLGLPDLDGTMVLREIKRNGLETPVLVLSARDGLHDKVQLLEIGADDYLIKPAALEEFLARVRALLRRHRSYGGSRLSLAGLTLDLETHRAFVDDTPLKLSSREWRLLVFLASRANHLVKKEEITGLLSDEPEDVSSNSVDVTISRLRRKIDASGLHLKTVRGLGYFMETPDGART